MHAWIHLAASIHPPAIIWGFRLAGATAFPEAGEVWLFNHSEDKASTLIDPCRFLMGVTTLLSCDKR
jgi:hypothetical protein